MESPEFIRQYTESCRSSRTSSQYPAVIITGPISHRHIPLRRPKEKSNVSAGDAPALPYEISARDPEARLRDR